MAKLKKSDIDHLSKLSKLTIDQKEESYLAKQFNKTIEIIETFNKVNTSGVVETSQVTGLTNVFREDAVDPTRILTQEEALSNAKRTHNGFFVVQAVITNDRSKTK